MLYRTEFTYGAKIVERGMKVLDTINTQKETEKQGLKRQVLINEKPQQGICLKKLPDRAIQIRLNFAGRTIWLVLWLILGFWVIRAWCEFYTVFKWVLSQL